MRVEQGGSVLTGLIGALLGAAIGAALWAIVGIAGYMASIVGLVGSLLPMILIFVVFYFMLIRPQRKKDKQVKEMLNNLKKGDRICTIGGIYGTILNIKDDTITLAVGKDNLSMVIARWGVRSVEELTIENDNGELLN